MDEKPEARLLVEVIALTHQVAGYDSVIAIHLSPKVW